MTQLLKIKEIKTIIQDFYKNEYKHLVPIGVDQTLSDYEFMMFQLENDLAGKDQFEGLSFFENELFCLILKNSSAGYSDKLINEFKNVLKEVE